MPNVEIHSGNGVRLNPGGQDAFWRDHESRYIFLEGGWGSGKTFIGSRKLIDLHLYNAFDANGIATFVPGAIVGPTKTGIADFMLPEIQAAAAEIGLTANYKFQIRHSGMLFRDVIHIPELSTRSRLSVIYVRTAEKPELITGWQIGHGWGDEPTRWRENHENPKADPFIQFTGRMRDPRARKQALLFTYTNEGDQTRVYQEAHSGKPGHSVYRAKTKDNPAVAEFCESLRATLTPELAEQYLEGGAMKLSGANVYSSFDSGTCLVDDVTLDPNAPLCVCLDFNIAPGMIALVGQRNPATGEFLFAAEIFDRGLALDGLLDRFHVEWVAKRGFKRVLFYGDPAGSARWAGTGESCYQIVRMKADQWEGVQYALRVKVAHPPVVDRINAVNVAMRNLKGECKVKINRKACPRLVRDFSSMKRNIKGEIDKSNPELTHAADAAGYWIEYDAPVRVETQTTGGRMAFGA